MTLSNELQELKDFQSDSRCVLSVYLNTNPADPEQQKGAWRIHLKSGLKRIEEYLTLSKDEVELNKYKSIKEKVMTEIEHNKFELSKGVVIFGSGDPELWSVHYVQVPVKTSFHWEKQPIIEELTYMLKAYPESGIVLPSFGEVRILDTAMGIVFDEMTFEFDSGLEVWKEQGGANPTQTRGPGGGKKDEVDDRLRENLERFYKDMGAVVERLIKERKWKEVNVMGEAELANSFAKVLREKPKSIVHKNMNNRSASKILSEVFEK